MNNTIEINGIKITAKFNDGMVMVTFEKDGKIVKTCNKYDFVRFVKPDNRSKVQAIIDAQDNGDDAKAYWAAKKAEIAKAEADYQERTGHYDAHKTMMDKVMSY